RAGASVGEQVGGAMPRLFGPGLAGAAVELAALARVLRNAQPAPAHRREVEQSIRIAPRRAQVQAEERLGLPPHLEAFAGICRHREKARIAKRSSVHAPGRKTGRYRNITGS